MEIGDVRGQGLFAGIEFVTDKATKEPVSEAQMAALMGNLLAEGVIAGRTNASFHRLNNVMNFAPCLIITEEQVDTVVSAVSAAIEKNILTKTGRLTMIVGILKEIKSRREAVSMTPAGVIAMIRNGHVVLVEKTAGEERAIPTRSIFHWGHIARHSC